MKEGFTLVELLIAITIAGLIIGTGAVRFSEFALSQRVRSQGLNLKNFLRGVQAEALAGIKPTGASGCSAGQELVAYRMSFPSVYQIRSQAVCQDVDTTGSSQNLRGPTSTFLMTTGLSFTAGAPFDFYVLGKGTSANTILTFSGYANPVRYYSLCITKGGEIRDCGYKTGSAPSCTCP